VVNLLYLERPLLTDESIAEWKSEAWCTAMTSLGKGDGGSEFSEMAQISTSHHSQEVIQQSLDAHYNHSRFSSTVDPL